MTVLVVDDEPALRRLVHRALEENGVDVLEAGDGEAALQLIQESDTPLDLVVTDIAMPKIDGQVLAQVLSVFRPEVPVLTMSGHPAHIGGTHSDRRVALLLKPFTVPQLLAAVQLARGRSRQVRRESEEHRAAAKRLHAAALEAQRRGEALASKSIDLVAMARVLQASPERRGEDVHQPTPPHITRLGA